eukprot:1652621-Rhodomonas_salina.2
MYEDEVVVDPDVAPDLGEQGADLGETGHDKGEQEASHPGSHRSKRLADKQDADAGVGVLRKTDPDPQPGTHVSTSPSLDEGEKGSALGDTEESSKLPRLDMSYRWTNGAQIPDEAKIALLSDRQLGRALAHHGFVMDLPADFFLDKTRGDKPTAVTIMCKLAHCHSNYKNVDYIEADIIKPQCLFKVDAKMEIPVSQEGKNDHHPSLRSMLDTIFNYLKTLHDIGLKERASKAVLATLLADWTQVNPRTSPASAASDESGPFRDQCINELWIVKAETTMLFKETVADLSLKDSLKPDPLTRKAAMQHHCFKDFWLDAKQVEWKGLWARGCFKKWKRSDLEPNDRVFGSRYHYKIKHDTVTGEGEDYEESFAPVPHSTIGRVMMALSAGNNYHLHTIYFTQAFIQADCLDEGVNWHVFVTPPPGCKEDEPGVVYECLRPLYGIPSSARALFETLDKWGLSHWQWASKTQCGVTLRVDCMGLGLLSLHTLMTV